MQLRSLNPFLGSGLLVAIIEMKQSKIMLKDFNPQGLYEAFRSIKKLHHNSIAHLFFVALMSSVGSMLGAWFAAGFIMHYLLT